MTLVGGPQNGRVIDMEFGYSHALRICRMTSAKAEWVGNGEARKPSQPQFEYDLYRAVEGASGGELHFQPATTPAP